MLENLELEKFDNVLIFSDSYNDDFDDDDFDEDDDIEVEDWDDDDEKA